MLAHKTIKVKNCGCYTLTDRLFLMQLVPATVKNVRAAVHMGLMDFIQGMKLSAQVSIIAWVSFLNMEERRRSSSEEVILIPIISTTLSLIHSFNIRVNPWR